jgi:hypothetical protein
VRTQRRGIGRVVVALLAAGVIIATVIAGSWLIAPSNDCTVSAGPGLFALRVVSDSNQTPVSGAQVTATSIPGGPGCQAAQPSTTLKFTTNGTEWYSLSTANWPSGFSLVVKYSGQSYDFTVSVPIEVLTCASLYIPSGMTNVTNAGFQNTCPSPTTTTVT